MLCPECGAYAGDDAIVCARCGKLLERSHVETEEEELMQFRQGRHLRREEKPAAEEDAPKRTGGSRSFEDTRPPETPESTGAVYTQRETLSATGRYYGYDKDSEDEAEAQRYVSSAIMQEYTRMPRVKRHISHRRMVNWAHMLIAAIVLLMVSVVCVFLYLTRTPDGQVIMARMGQDATAAAMWQVGEERYNAGNVHQAIEYFLIARAKDEEAKAPNATGLLLLGEAYEANGELVAAEEVYAYVYTEVVPSAPEAYRAQVRVLQEMGRNAEAAKLLETAYAKTGLTTFRSQRSEILPAIPTVSVLPGYYTQKKTVALEQAQEHSIYYTHDMYAPLPEQGILYEAPLELGEGEHVVRAVAVDGDLVSDEMQVTYAIYMPTPLQPDANLAPGEYSSARKNVRLSPGSLSKEDLEKNPGYAATLKDEVAQTITIYYTIDGSMPDADSPIYTGEPIVMDTSGYMTLRAVSVNGYGKQGNMKEVKIKLSLRTKSKAVYNMEDTIDSLKLGTTTREVFLTKYGEGTGTEPVYLYGVDGECERHLYPWGYASFMKQNTGWTLAEVYLTSNALSAPRGTGVGMTEKEITEKFRDFGQVVSPSGNRGLYENIENSDKGKIYVLEEGGKVIRYRTDTTDAHVWQLDYNLNEAGKVTSIHWLYER